MMATTQTRFIFTGSFSNYLKSPRNTALLDSFFNMLIPPWLVIMLVVFMYVSLEIEHQASSLKVLELSSCCESVELGQGYLVELWHDLMCKRGKHLLK